VRLGRDCLPGMSRSLCSFLPVIGGVAVWFFRTCQFKFNLSIFLACFSPTLSISRREASHPMSRTTSAVSTCRGTPTETRNESQNAHRLEDRRGCWKSRTRSKARHACSEGLCTCRPPTNLFGPHGPSGERSTTRPIAQLLIDPSFGAAEPMHSSCRPDPDRLEAQVPKP
jgi:hypothetical protein